MPTRSTARSRSSATPPPPWDRLVELLGRVLVWVIERIGDVVGAGFGWVLVTAAALLLAGLGLLVQRSVRWAGRRGARIAGPAAAAARTVDRFAEADRL